MNRYYLRLFTGLIILCFELLLSKPIHAQLQIAQKDELNEYKKFITLQLDSLKNNGTLIVILKSKSKAIEAYEKAGNTKVVNEMMADNLKLNTLLYKSFSRYWTFCPIHFIYANDLKTFASNPAAKVFLDSNLKYDTAIQLKVPFFLYLDYGNYFEKQVGIYDTKPGSWKAKEYTNFDPSEGVPVKRSCLVIKDKEFKLFRVPFPAYAQYWTNMFTTVQIFNNRFIEAFKEGFDGK